MSSSLNRKLENLLILKLLRFIRIIRQNWFERGMASVFNFDKQFTRLCISVEKVPQSFLWPTSKQPPYPTSGNHNYINLMVTLTVRLGLLDVDDLCLMDIIKESQLRLVDRSWHVWKLELSWFGNILNNASIFDCHCGLTTICLCGYVTLL